MSYLMKGIFTLSLVSFLIACGGEDEEQNFSMNNGGKADGETCAGKLGNISGTVKFYNKTKNFGFIAGDDGLDYFVHASGLVEGVEITEGDSVCFSNIAGDRGLQAEKVEKSTPQQIVAAPIIEQPSTPTPYPKCAGKLGNISGTVKFYNKTKNFGFIAGDDGLDYFVHASGLVEGVEITEGDSVCFSNIAGDRGPKAEKVEKI